MNKELENRITKFLELFEEVFDRDWEYTKEMMGVYAETEEQKRNKKEIGLESIDTIANDGTFLNPKIEDETEDWGNRGALLSEYRRVKKMLKEK